MEVGLLHFQTQALEPHSSWGANGGINLGLRHERRGEYRRVDRHKTWMNNFTTFFVFFSEFISQVMRVFNDPSRLRAR